jgi:hypothetical protein
MHLHDSAHPAALHVSDAKKHQKCLRIELTETKLGHRPSCQTAVVQPASPLGVPSSATRSNASVRASHCGRVSQMRRQPMNRLQLVAAYVALLATCTAGALHLGLWSVCAGSCSLALISILTPRVASAPQIQGGSGIGEPLLIASSILNGSAVASAAYIFGYGARWVWGL